MGAGAPPYTVLRSPPRAHGCSRVRTTLRGREVPSSVPIPARPGPASAPAPSVPSSHRGNLRWAQRAPLTPTRGLRRALRVPGSTAAALLPTQRPAPFAVPPGAGFQRSLGPATRLAAAGAARREPAWEPPAPGPSPRPPRRALPVEPAGSERGPMGGCARRPASLRTNRGPRRAESGATPTSTRACAGGGGTAGWARKPRAGGGSLGRSNTSERVEGAEGEEGAVQHSPGTRAGDGPGPARLEAA